MMSPSYSSLFVRAISSAVSAALILVSPGVSAHRAFANTVVSVPANVAAPQVHLGGFSSGLAGQAGPSSSAQGLSAPQTGSLPTLPSLSVTMSGPTGVRTAPSLAGDGALLKGVPGQVLGREAALTSSVPGAKSAAVRSVAAPAGNGKTAGVVGRLMDAVKRVPAMLKLGGSDLKLEAGRPFGGSMGRTAAITPSSVRGLFGPRRSTIGLRRPGNGIAEQGDSERDPRNPTGDQVAAFAAELGRSFEPGERVDSEMQKLIAQEIGMPEAAVPTAMAVITNAGHFAALSNGNYIFVSLSEKSSTDSNNVKTARELAIKGLELLNDAKLSSRAKAVDALGEALSLQQGALQKAAKAEAKAEAIFRDMTQVEILLANAKLELLRDVLKQYESRPEVQDTGPNSGKIKQAVAEARKHLEDAYFDLNHQPAPLEKRIVPMLTTWIGKLGPADELEGEDARGVANGLKQLPEFVAKLSQLPTKSLVPVGKPGSPSESRQGLEQARTRREFQALDKNRFKNLHEFGTNLTALAAEGKLSPLVGRETELRQAIKTLMRVEKNNPVFIGEHGVGKTKIVEGLAQMIVDGKVPQLKGVNIFKLDVGALVAGTTLRGQFEERVQGVLQDAKAAGGKALIFIDEIHNIVGLGSAQGTSDASSMLKEALSSGDISIIGATTLEEYRKIEKDGALERRFNPVKLAPPTTEEAIEIVEGVKSRYSKKHGVTISKETVRAAVALAGRYIKARFLPDSALDVLDDAAAEVSMKAFEAQQRGEEPVYEVLPEDIAFEISQRTGIPVTEATEDDLAALRKLPGDLESRVIGQTPAVEKVVRAIRRGRLGYAEEKSPVGTFVFLGPTGVGKTEFVRVLARNQFGSERNIVRIDMSEYQEKHTVSRLISAPPGYVGYESGGQLTEPVRRNPHTVILLDEIEKAAPEVLDVLLQVIEDGRLTDGQGRTVDFSNAIIVMTSNIGGSLSHMKPKRGIGFLAELDLKQPTKNVQRGEYVQAFKGAVRPEFFNRIGKDHVVVFNNLDRDDLSKILDLRVADLNERLKGKGMIVSLTESARKHLLDEAVSEENRVFGARPLKQAIERQVTDLIVDAELAGEIGKGDRVSVHHTARKGLYVRKGKGRAVSMGGYIGLAPLVAFALPAPWVLPAAIAAAVIGIGYFVYRHLSAGSGFQAQVQGRSPFADKIWTSKRYVRILQASIYGGFAVGVAGFGLLHSLIGNYSLLLVPAVTVAGVFIGDRVARGSAQAVAKRHEARILGLPGVIGVGVGRTAEGKSAIAAYYASELDLKRYSHRLPEFIDRYPVVAEFVDGRTLPAGPTAGTLLQSAAKLAGVNFLAGPKLAAAQAEESEELKADEVMFYWEVRQAIDRMLDDFVKQNSGWWARVTGKQRVVEMAAQAFRQEIRRGRKPAFDITTTEDGVKKALRGPNGETVAELLWMQLKRETGYSESDLQRFLSLSRRVNKRNAGRMDALGPKFQVSLPYGGLIGRVNTAVLGGRLGKLPVLSAAARKLPGGLPADGHYYGKKAWLVKHYKTVLQIGIFVGFAAGLLSFGLLFPVIGAWSVPLFILGTLAGTLAGDRLARGSVERVVKRYENRLLHMPGVRAVTVGRTEDGRKAIAVHYESQKARDAHASELPEMIDGYDVVVRVAGVRILPAVSVAGRTGSHQEPASAGITGRLMSSFIARGVRELPGGLPADGHYYGKKAWLVKSYKLKLELGIIGGLALGVGAMALLMPVIGAYAIMLFPAGVLTGAFVGDRLARGPVEKVAARYEARIKRMPGVKTVGVGRTEDGRKAVVVYYESKKARNAHASELPEMMDGYDVVARVIDAEILPAAAGKLFGASAQTSGRNGASSLKGKLFKDYYGKKAWLVGHYKSVLQLGIFAGFAAGLFSFALLFPVIGGLSVLFLPVGVLAGTLIGDRLARGSVETVVKRHEEKLKGMPGVRHVAAGRTTDGRKAVVVYYDSEDALAAHSSRLPELIDGYDVLAAVTGSPFAGVRPAEGERVQTLGAENLPADLGLGQGLGGRVRSFLERTSQTTLPLAMALGIAAAVMLYDVIGGGAFLYLPFSVVAGSLVTGAVGTAGQRKQKAWLSKRYVPILQAGIFLGFTAGTLGFLLLHSATGGLSVMLLPLGVVAGTLLGDRLARGSIEAVAKRYEGRFRKLPGVMGVGIEPIDGRKTLVIYYGSKEDFDAYSGGLPELIDGYPVTASTVEEGMPTTV